MSIFVFFFGFCCYIFVGCLIYSEFVSLINSIVGFREAYEDDRAVHLVMELCEGGELFDRIIARGHYTERAAAAVTKTIVEVVQLCHHHGVIHRDLKPENFLFANKKENSPLKAIDFGLSIFFKPGMIWLFVEYDCFGDLR